MSAPADHHEGQDLTAESKPPLPRQSSGSGSASSSSGADDTDLEKRASGSGKRSAKSDDVDAPDPGDVEAAAAAVADAYGPGSRRFVHIKERERFYQFWRPKELPPPPPKSLDDAPTTPYVTANWLSQLTYHWADPIMWLGYKRPLEATDLWAMPEKHSAEVLSGRFLVNWERRQQEAVEYNAKLEKGEIPVGWKRKISWSMHIAMQRAKGKRASVEGGLAERERQWRAPPPAEPESPAKGAAGDKKKEEGAADGKGKKAAAKAPKSLSGHKKPDLALALVEMFKWQLVLATIIKTCGDVAQITSPLIVRRIIEFGSRTYAHARDPVRFPPTNAGEGVGLSIALFAMQVFGSLCQHQFFFRSMSMGVHARTTLISAIFQRATNLGQKDRSAGKLLNHASADVSRIDFAAQWWLLAFSAPITLILCLALLIVQIGAPALAGFAVLIVAMPLQGVAIKSMFAARKASMQFTDRRVKLVNELLSSIRVVKSFSNESRFLDRLGSVRTTELKGIRKLIFIRSANNAIAFSLPVLASVVAFIIYGANNPLNPARIFTALTLFNLLRMPLLFLPLSFSAATDGYQAIQRLDGVFTAQIMKDQSEHDEDAKFALRLSDATFQYEALPPTPDDGPTKAKGGRQAKRAAAKKAKKDKAAAAAEAKESSSGGASAVHGGTSTPRDGARSLLRKALHHDHANSRSRSASPAPASGVATPQMKEAEMAADLGKDHDDATVEPAGHALLPGTATPPAAGAETPDSTDEEPFKLQSLNLEIARGELIGIVGPVGCGKSSLLEGLLGEVPLKSGRVIWGGKDRLAYVPQVPWIQAASVRDNILFGRPFDEERYWNVIKLCELEADLVLLSQGDMTEIGEKGTNLSGGQKARVGLARAIYFDASTFIIDDPLSAVDAHVSRALFHNAILDLRARGKTVLLVTHAIHVLPYCDRIVTLGNEGRIAEVGTYDRLVAAGGPFSRLVEEFGGDDEKEDEDEKVKEDEGIEDGAPKKGGFTRAEMTDVGGKKALMEAEERNTGTISGETWKAYFRAARGHITIPIVIASLALMNGATIMNSYWLIYWQEDKFDEAQGFYMGIYAFLGVLQAIFTFVMGVATGVMGFYACKHLHAAAMERILYAPLTTFFDVTPKGRIMNRVSKDIDTIDNTLIDSMRMAASTLANVIGAIILITILTHYFVIAVAVVLVFYALGAVVYRRSATEIKRLDAVLRSSLYAHFSESLSGLQVVRAYGELGRFLDDHRRYLDIENRAYFFSIVNQRWLGIRLDMMGAFLVFIVAILSSVGANSISPGQVGLALSYMLTVSQAFSWVVRQVSEVQNDMNSVERIQHYATELDQEASQISAAPNLVSPQWPEHGALRLENVKLRYRPGLPLVLHGISIDVKAGEKIGVVGRTGAGKSSMLTALLRLVELEEGKVIIDGVDVSKIGLRDLRTRVAVLPQEPTLFSGTLRSNLDPFGQYDDERLNNALKRAYLIDSEDEPVHPVPVEAGADGAAPSELPSGAATPAHGEPGAAAAAHKKTRFTLDTELLEEGSNLSLGERSLVSLARALVKQSNIILLDEATASVDVQTDQRIQHTIRTEFRDATLLCVAHRLRTIITYDRVLVMDKGTVAELASPIDLFDQGGIFFQMCEKASLPREEIVRANEERLERARIAQAERR